MERPGGLDRPEPPPRHPGRDHPTAPGPPATDGVRLTRPGWDRLTVEPYAERMRRDDVRRVDEPGRWDTPADALSRYRPERAGLAPMTLAEADEHIAAHAAERPWLRPALDAEPGTRLLAASFDVGQGHALERHEGGVTREQTDRRVRCLEDPAKIPDADRKPGTDAYTTATHACGVYATRIADPDAFAVCAARAVEHPDVRTALDRPYDPLRQARGVALPLADLLGSEGYKYCDGHRLEPFHGSLEVATDCRAAWVDAMRNNHHPDVPEPRSAPLRQDDFKESTVRIYFRPTHDRSGWEVATMYVQPRPPGGGA